MHTITQHVILKEHVPKRICGQVRPYTPHLQCSAPIRTFKKHSLFRKERLPSFHGSAHYFGMISERVPPTVRSLLYRDLTIADHHLQTSNHPSAHKL